ncbi:uncharacterized protein Triagg1_3616 [Trichoderma aggressivum f. europaeum]|uniref:Uncharacterized protein n=1 Tax=Trichoderma aggressivum f. europaeum TaxID=173218 RepID=A0AAE1JD21_9HYPO|nr:hypothetical protein Triagg1_3616 [Trichoderma aggressivum f. europaeum]
MGIRKNIRRLLCLGRREPDVEQSPRPLQHWEIRNNIISIITGHLDQTPLVCFASVCPDFYNGYFHPSIAEQQRIQVGLGRVPVRAYRCYDCDAYHPLRQEYWFNAQFFTCNDFNGGHLSPQHLPMRGFDYSLSVPFELARKIMNAPLDQSSHDCPVEQLVPRYPLQTYQENVAYTRSWQARIIDDQLVLHSYTALTLTIDRRLPGQSVNMGIISICRHVNTGRLLLVHREPPQENYFSRRHGSILSCPVCDTDYSIDIIWEGGHWVVGISTYHVLETAKTKSNWTWNVMSYCPEEARKSPRVRKMMGTPPGIAMHKWYTQSIMTLDRRPEGDWAPQPALQSDPHYLSRPVYLQ